MMLERGSSGGHASFGEVKDLIESNEDLKEEVRMLEDRLKAFAGLPADLEVARNEVRRAERELAGWKSKRDQLFDELGTG